MQFGILGSLEARTGNVPCLLGPFKQRVVLALLLCSANRIVPVDLLADALWGDDLPRTAYKNLQVYISTLRRLLFAGDGMTRLTYRIRGYQMQLSSDELDSLTFEDMTHEGRQALRGGAVAAAARTLETALTMWRGDALMDLRTVPAIDAEATRLEKRRLSVYEDWIEAELAIGNHAHILDSIEDLVRRHPMRERLRSSQFIALYRCGRQAEALAEFDELRQLLARELGLQPSAALGRLYQSILVDDPSLAAPRGGAAVSLAPLRDAAAPALAVADTTAHLNQLTRDLEDYTGRDRLTGLLVNAVRAERRSARVTLLIGPPGIGKTALAVHVGHSVITSFPDGQIIVRLRSPSGRPRSSAEVLGELLRSFGLDARLPRTVEERAALYRSWLAERNLLIILDDARDEAQVRPLLPGVGGSEVLVTSRHYLGGLEAARHVTLEPFSAAEGVRLLGLIAGPDRIGPARADAECIVTACAGVPAAIRICGAKLASQPRVTLADFAAKLDDERRLLDEMSVGDLAIRRYAAEYERDLTARDRMAFLRVGLLPGNRFSTADFAKVLGVPPDDAEIVLDRLTSVSVIMSSAGPDTPGDPTFSVPPWLLAYARERMHTSTMPPP